MYYLVRWKDGHTSRFFTYNRNKAIKLIWNFNVVNVWIDQNQEDE